MLKSLLIANRGEIACRTVDVAAGDTVTKGQKLVTLEAMKMEYGLVAPFDGTVAELDAQAGQQVSEGRMPVRIERAEAI